MRKTFCANAILKGGTMDKLTEFSQALGGMPVGALIALVILAGFALAAYAIYAVTKITKGR